MSWRGLWLGGDPQSVGAAPDPSFSFANERTFLAWNRTALTLIGVGLIFTQLIPPFELHGARLAIGLPLIVFGTIVAAVSSRQWAVKERAMRLGRPLPRQWLAIGLTAGITAVTLVTIVVIALWGGA